MGRWITKNGAHVWIENADEQLHNALDRHYSTTTYHDVEIGPVERERICHELNNWCNIYEPKSKYKKGHTYVKPIGDYIYTFKIIDYNKYEIVEKILIDDEDW